MNVAFPVIKADVGSIGGHTRASDVQIALLRERVTAACGGSKPLPIDGMVTHTGDGWFALGMSAESKPKRTACARPASAAIFRASLEFGVGGFGGVLAGSRGQGQAQPGAANP